MILLCDVYDFVHSEELYDALKDEVDFDIQTRLPKGEKYVPFQEVNFLLGGVPLVNYAIYLRDLEDACLNAGFAPL